MLYSTLLFTFAVEITHANPSSCSEPLRKTALPMAKPCQGDNAKACNVIDEAIQNKTLDVCKAVPDKVSPEFEQQLSKLMVTVLQPGAAKESVGKCLQPVRGEIFEPGLASAGWVSLWRNPQAKGEPYKERCLLNSPIKVKDKINDDTDYVLQLVKSDTHKTPTTCSNFWEKESYTKLPAAQVRAMRFRALVMKFAEKCKH